MTDKVVKLLDQKVKEKWLSWSDQFELAAETHLSVHKVEEMALAKGIVPARYQRNINAISAGEQHSLAEARVAVIGCGGLGGYIIEELARIGVGSITAWDYDNFEEHNLNRQLYSEIDGIGQSKVKAAARRIGIINPAVQFNAHFCKFDNQNGKEYLRGIQVVVDALDNIPTRLMLANVCRDLNIPLVHGALGGWYGQVTTQFPGEDTLEQIYGHLDNPRGIEIDHGLLSFIPATVASLQVAEVVKILLGRGNLLRRKLMFINLLDMDIEIMELPNS
jgi:molybdopterin/thiamine biosynthesis adenylyltransferase